MNTLIRQLIIHECANYVNSRCILHTGCCRVIASHTDCEYFNTHVRPLLENKYVTGQLRRRATQCAGEVPQPALQLSLFNE